MRRLIALFFLSLMLLSGCITLTGPVFQPTEPVADKALIYLYWTDLHVGRTGTLNFSIKANSEEITTMYSGGFYTYYAPPGVLKFESHLNFGFMSAGLLDVALAPTQRLKLDVEAGETYFVRCVDTFMPRGRALLMFVVDEKRGLYEMRGAKKLSDPQKNKAPNDPDE